MWNLGAKVWANTPATELDEHDASQSSSTPEGREEKAIPIGYTTSLSDDSSGLDGSVQNGVREVEAVTSAWDTKSLILVFFLYASTRLTGHIRKLTMSKHLRDLHSRLYALYNVHSILGVCHKRLLFAFSHGDYRYPFEHSWGSVTLAAVQDH
jgi:hypothetical protein